MQTVKSETGRIWTAENLEIDGRKHFSWQEAMENAPEGFRLPTEEEWQEELESWNSKDAVGALASPLKLSADGFIRSSYSESLLYVGSYGSYWFRSLSGGYMGFNSIGTYLFPDYRAYRFSVRYIKE